MSLLFFNAPLFLSSPGTLGYGGEIGIIGIISLFFALSIGHAIADFALQGDFMSQAKSRKADISKFFGGKTPRGVWFHVLTAHCLIHAGTVWLITGSLALSALEFFVHWIIDLIKGEGLIGFNTDQLLHYLTKVVIVALYFQG